MLGGRYVLINRIATGGMGEVWRARDTRTGHAVAAKVLRPELTGEEISLSRLRLEAKNAMQAKHPNIAAILDSGEEDGQGWIVMELVEGEPLSKYVGDGKTLSAEYLIPILIQCAYALDGVAQAGIVHRDIKPANIIVRPDGLAKLTDFGISYSAGQANLTAAGMVMGTAQYLAPEQAMGEVASFSGDLYSLGIVAYEALAGQRPFTGKSVVDIAMAHVSEDVPNLPANVPDPLADIIFGLLAKDPAHRPRSGTALVRALNRVADDLQIETAARPLPPIQKVETGKPEQRTTPGKPARRAATQPPARRAAAQEGSNASAGSRALPPSIPPSISPATSPGGGRPDGTASTSGLGKTWKPLAVGAPPRANKPALPRRSSGGQSGPNWLMVTGVALLVLAVLLLIFTMIRSRGAPQAGPAPDFGPGFHIELEATTASSEYRQEVQACLTPTHVC